MNRLASALNQNDDIFFAKEDKWIEDEISASKFPDERLAKRYRGLLGQLWNSLGSPIPFACQDWANTKVLIVFSQMRKSIDLPPRNWTILN